MHRHRGFLDNVDSLQRSDLDANVGVSPTRNMGVCAYCNKEGKMTREEVFPKCLVRRTPSYEANIDHSSPRKPLQAIPVVCATHVLPFLWRISPSLSRHRSSRPRSHSFDIDNLLNRHTFYSSALRVRELRIYDPVPMKLMNKRCLRVPLASLALRARFASRLGPLSIQRWAPHPMQSEWPA